MGIPPVNGSVKECTTNETVENDIHQEISGHFSRADITPIYQGALFKLLGYSVDIKTATDIIKGTFEPPEGTSLATLIILGEIT